MQFNHNTQKLACLKGQSISSADLNHYDWSKVITDIQTLTTQQLTLENIAHYAGCSQPTISLLKSRKQLNPSYSTGQALVYLHQKITDLRGDQLKIKILVSDIRGF